MRDVVRDVKSYGRDAVLIYAGDHDASGEDIDRDFVARTDCWAHVDRIALSAAQCLEFDLPPAPGKPADSRAGGFIARHGELRQVELDALNPTDLRSLYSSAIALWWNDDAYAAVIEREELDRSKLAELPGGVR